MNIAIIGYGHMGSGIAKRAVAAGHHVTLAGRHLDRAGDVAREVNASAAPTPEAAQRADVVIFATPYDELANAVKAAGDLKGKVVVDITNPLKPDYSGLQIGHTTSAAEETQKLAPGAKVVKAFNTVFAQIFAKSPDFGDHQHVPVFYAGDDKGAKDKVRQLAETMGFDAIDTGGITSARYLEPLGMLNITLGYQLGQGTDIAPTWMRRQ